MDGPRFAHPSEAAFARLLDAAGVRWEYEPHRFVLERDARGRPVRELVPDFYLPELDVYVECTAMRARHATRKRRKVRQAVSRYGIVVTLRERGDLERLDREFGSSPPEAA